MMEEGPGASEGGGMEHRQDADKGARRVPSSLEDRRNHVGAAGSIDVEHGRGDHRQHGCRGGSGCRRVGTACVHRGADPSIDLGIAFGHLLLDMPFGESP